MGLIAEVLSFFRGEDTEAKVSYAVGDLGGEDLVTVPQYQGSGFDARPLPGDFMLVVPGPEKGTFVVAGYLDPSNAGVAREGDVRLYVRNGSGEVQGELHLTNDGSAPDWQGPVGALIARADRVEAELDKIKDAHNTHKHSYNDSKGSNATATPSLTDVPSSVAAAPGEAIPAFQYTPGTVGSDTGYVT